MQVPIVAFAASAGGLEALFELLPGLPTSSGMAFVIIQHLDRDHRSLLGELLAKKTALPVTTIEHTLAVSPSHVYVIPPNASVSLEGERFRLTPREESRAPHHPADVFFKSLAAEQGESSIAVVLSGGDGDGALGIQAIKEAGGITFAQAPESAKFPSMPSHAIATGCIDYVLPPSEISREITRLGAHPYLMFRTEVQREDGALGAEPVDEEKILRTIFRRVSAAHGINFQHYKRSTLRRRLARRMAVRKAENLQDYLGILEEDAAEVAALYQDFLIRVTSFFRDPEAFEQLRTSVFPRVCEGRPTNEPVRIWVPGCATGEEVYSIAIALTEYLTESHSTSQIQIFGTDVSETAIDRARAGVYLENIAGEVSSGRLERFFVKDDGHYRVVKTVRDVCVFARHDVTRDPPFSRLDLVSCRNLLIYLDTAAQRRVMQLFHYAIRPQGFLLLGPSESVGSTSALFDLIDKHQRLFVRKSAAASRELDFVSRESAPPALVSEATSAQFNPLQASDSIEREADRFLLARYAPSSLLLDDALNILQFRGETSPYLEHASGPASLNLHRVVRRELLVEISPAIQEARETGRPCRREGLRVEPLTNVTLEVIPFRAADDGRCFLVIFEDAAASRVRGEDRTAPARPESEKDQRLAQLEREIESTRLYLQATIERHDGVKEELKSAHEEVLSANEAFQSSNEELETAKEELQSSNEELSTTNDELRSRNRELAASNAEVQLAREVATRAQHYAEAIIESVREPLLVLDANLVVLRANPAFYQNLKIRRSDTNGTPLRALDAGKWNVPALLDKLDAVLTKNVPLDDFQLAYPRLADAVPRKLCLTGRKIPGDAERTQLLLLAIEDITERDADEVQLREAGRRKDEFLAMLAHELRNPLTPITHAIRLLKRTPEGPSTSHLYDVIERQTHRLVRLVDELLDIARISRGSFELKRELLDFSAIVRQAADAAGAKFEERRQELSMLLPQAAVMVEGDPVRLEQVMANLLENAAKYTAPEGRIQLRLTADDAEATLSVKDNGIGVAPEHLTAIFELFRQVDSSLARSEGGLGIGLTLVRRVLEMHGGRIEARSAGVGHGTDFILRLPIADGDERRAINGGQRSDPEPKQSGGRRVLVVDDNADAAETVALLAQYWGHEARVVHDGPTALSVALEFAPEFALVDIGLPGMDGFEVGRRLKKQFPKICLVAMTGYGRDEDRQRTHAAGFDAHLVKPADIDALQRILSAGSRGGNDGDRLALQ